MIPENLRPWPAYCLARRKPGPVCRRVKYPRWPPRRSASSPCPPSASPPKSRLRPGPLRPDAAAMRQFDLRRKQKLGVFRGQFSHATWRRRPILRVNKKFCPVRLDADALFDYPFCVMSGNENFSLTQKERAAVSQIPRPGRIPAGQPGLLGREMGQSVPPGNQGVLSGVPAPGDPDDPSDFLHRQSDPPAGVPNTARPPSWKDWRSTAGWCWSIPRRA